MNDPFAAEVGSTLRELHPAENIVAFYDGRIPGHRIFSPEPNWVDDGAYELLGTASYALVAGTDALVYDAHITLAHARRIRRRLEELGARRVRLVLSHWHLDHVAGNAAFADCEIIAHARTSALLRKHRAAIEAGTHSGPPEIVPLVMPTTIYEGSLALKVGSIPVELRNVDVHSEDGTLLLFPERRLLLAGDALEDPVTYVVKPDRLDRHLADLTRMATWPVDWILPNHGSEPVIAAGGYGPGLVRNSAVCRAPAAQPHRSNPPDAGPRHLHRTGPQCRRPHLVGTLRGCPPPQSRGSAWGGRTLGDGHQPPSTDNPLTFVLHERRSFKHGSSMQLSAHPEAVKVQCAGASGGDASGAAKSPSRSGSSLRIGKRFIGLA